MSKMKFRLFVPFMFLLVFAILFLISFILTSYSSSDKSFVAKDFVSVQLYEDDDYYFTEFDYKGFYTDVEFTFEPKDFLFKQKRTFFNLLNIYIPTDSSIIYPNDYVTNSDGTITFNPYNNPLKIRVSKNNDASNPWNSFFFSISPSPTFTTPYFAFTLKQTLNGDVVRYEHITSRYYKYDNIVSPISKKNYLFVPKMFFQEERTIMSQSIFNKNDAK